MISLNEESKTTSMNTWNKIQALILMPLYMIVLAFVLYFLASLTFIRAEGIIAIVVLPIAFCWIYVPVSKKYHFEELYYIDGDKPLKDKILKHRRAMAEYSIIAFFVAAFAFLFHLTQ